MMVLVCMCVCVSRITGPRIQLDSMAVVDGCRIYLDLNHGSTESLLHGILL